MNTELDVETVVRTAVAHVARVYPEMDIEDLYQEASLWVAEHPEQVEYRMNMRHPATAAMFLQRDIARRLHNFSRRERAYMAGYEPADEYTYSAQGIQLRGLIAECLRALVTGTREPAKVDSVGPSNTDPAEASNNFLVSMLDIEKGWDQLGEEDRKLLASFFVYEVAAAQLAAEHGISDRQVYNMLKGALKRLVGPLNGAR